MADTFEEIRNTLAEDLRDDSLYSTFAFPPQSPLPMTLVLFPGTPWIEQAQIGRNNIMLNLTVRLNAAAAINNNDLLNLESMVISVLRNMPAYAQWTDISAPTMDEDNGLTYVELTVRVTANIEEN
jgi:hypothetical protein